MRKKIEKKKKFWMGEVLLRVKAFWNLAQKKNFEKNKKNWEGGPLFYPPPGPPGVGGGRNGMKFERTLETLEMNPCAKFQVPGLPGSSK